MNIKKTITLALTLILCLSICSCGHEPETETSLMTSENLVGTWLFEKGDLYKLSDTKTVQFEIYRGGTAKEIYEGNSINNFTWEISENDNEVVNFTMQWGGGSGSPKGFTIEKNDSEVLELHSVDGNTILIKTAE